MSSGELKGEQRMEFSCDADIDMEGPFPRQARFVIKMSIPDAEVANHVEKNGNGWAMMFLNLLEEAINLHERQQSELPAAYK